MSQNNTTRLVLTHILSFPKCLYFSEYVFFYTFLSCWLVVVFHRCDINNRPIFTKCGAYDPAISNHQLIYIIFGLMNAVAHKHKPRVVPFRSTKNISNTMFDFPNLPRLSGTFNRSFPYMSW